MAEYLFKDFPPISEKQWKQKIQFDLKGKEYNETLLSHTKDGISIQPIYHKDSYKQIANSTQKSDFKICQRIFIADTNIANKISHEAIKGGVESILFIANTPFDINSVLKEIPNEIELQFQLNFLSESFISDLSSQIENHTTFLNIDIVGNLVEDGNWFTNLPSDFKSFESIRNKNLKNTTAFSINTDVYQNAGANIPQQIGYALAHGFEYLNQCLLKNEQHLDLNINVAVGGNYFFEIAKLRAFRILWDIVSKDLGIASKIHITAFPSTRNKTLYDYNTNMLRTTSESMSAILGGADTVCNLAYDAIYHKSNKFGERISRNQLLILKEESYLSEANTIANGSYYIERLTNEIAEISLNIFKEVERNGGFLKQLKIGAIQNAIEKSALKEQALFDEGSITLLGTNKYINTEDRMKNDLELYPFVKTKPRRTLIKPLIAKRLSEQIEKERLENEA